MNIRSLSLVILLAAVPSLAQDPAGRPAEPAGGGALAPYLASGPRELFARGVELAERGSVREAKALFRALTLAYPDLPEPHINLAVLLAAEGGTEESAQEAEAAIRAHPMCRAAFDLDFQHQLGSFSSGLLDAATRTRAAAPAPATSVPAPAPPATPASVPARPAALDFGDATRVVRQAADPCLNFRPQPLTTSTPVECLSPGIRIRLLETSGQWSRVALRDGREGWMAAAFLAKPDP